MLQKIKEKYDLDLKSTYFIGDSYGDILAAQYAGCIPILVHTGNGQKTLEDNPAWANLLNFPDLAHAVRYVIGKK